MRLNRFLAAAGITSRRGADELIASGRVTVNGKPCTDFHFQPSATDHVKVARRLIRLPLPIYLALNKPRGFVCTRRDPHSRDIIYDLLPPKFANLSYIGRLDAQTEGLLLLTNDGQLVQQLSHPRFRIEKEYEAVLDKPATSELTHRLLHGTVLEGKRARAARVQQISPTRLRIVLEQGLNRQIRRMLERFGFRPKRLVRLRIGKLWLGDLRPAAWRVLTRRELRQLTECTELLR